MWPLLLLLIGPFCPVKTRPLRPGVIVRRERAIGVIAINPQHHVAIRPLRTWHGIASGFALAMTNPVILLGGEKAIAHSP